MSNTFKRELEALINKWSRENGSNTPDFILAEHLVQCLINFDAGIRERERWYGRTAQAKQDDRVWWTCAEGTHYGQGARGYRYQA